MKTITRGALLALTMLASAAAEAGDYPGDAEFARIDYPGAEAVLDSAIRLNPSDPELLWRMSRLYVVWGDVTRSDAKEKMYRDAEKYAYRALLADSANANVRTSMAAALGNIAMFEGSKGKVRLANEIRRQLDAALALNPDDDVALSILGTFHRQIGKVSWIERQLAAMFIGSLPEGGFEEAEVALKRAVALNPRFMRHRYELGVLYVDWDREEEAKEVFREAVESPIVVANDRSLRQRMKEYLESGDWKYDR
jgi:tetratricopeptide (TPR) repeat protein